VNISSPHIDISLSKCYADFRYITITVCYVSPKRATENRRRKMKKTSTQTSNPSEAEKIQLPDQTLQKLLVTQVTRLFLILVVALIVVSGIFMYFSNMNTLHEMANVALNSTSSAVERTLYTLEVNAMNVAALETIRDTGASKEEKLEAMEGVRVQNQYDEVGFVELNGMGYSNYGDFDFNDQLHFKTTSKGEVFVVKTIINRFNIFFFNNSATTEIYTE